MASNPQSTGCPTSEKLGEEFKPWPLLPSANAAKLGEWDSIADSPTQNGIAVFVAACAALHNNDGGVLHLGFDEKTRLPRGGLNEQQILERYDDDSVFIPVLNAYLIPVPVIRSEVCQMNGTPWLRVQIDSGVTIPTALKNGFDRAKRG